LTGKVVKNIDYFSALETLLIRSTNSLYLLTYFLTSGIRKSTTGLWLGLRRGVFTCVGWQVTPCDPL